MPWDTLVSLKGSMLWVSQDHALKFAKSAAVSETWTVV